MFPGRDQQHPHCPATQLFPCLGWEICLHFHHHFVLSLPCLWSYLRYSTDELIFFSSFWPLFNELPNEKVFNESILWGSATLQAGRLWVLLVHSGVWVTDLPQLHGALCFFVSGQRSVWLSKRYREEILSQQVIPFFFHDFTHAGGWWAGLAHNDKSAEKWLRNINWKLTLSLDQHHKCPAWLYEWNDRPVWK